MRQLLSVTAALVLILASLEASAREPLSEPRAMLYYEVSFGGGAAADRTSTFGFRMDRAEYAEDHDIDHSRSMRRPAILELKMNRDGIQSLTVSGRDYLHLYRVHHAAEGEAEETASEAEGETAETETDGDGEQLPKYPQVGRDIGDTITTVMEKAPAGVIIGVGLGIALLAGVGG